MNNMKVFEGKLVAENIRIGIVCSRFNEFIVSKLLAAHWTVFPATMFRRKTSKWPGVRAPLKFR